MSHYAHTLSQHISAQDYEFPAPAIKETNDYIIPLTLLRQGLTVIVPVIAGAQPGGEVFVLINSNYGFVSKYFTLTDTEQDHEVRFEPEDLVNIANAGAVQYLYHGIPFGGSFPRDCFFEEAVPTPEVREYDESAPGVYRLPSEAADNGIHVQIKPYENMAVGDRVTLLATTTSEKTGKWLDYDVVQSDISRPLEFTYEADTLKDLRPGTIHLSCTVSRGNQQYQSRSITIELLPLLPYPEPVHGHFDTPGLGHFPPIFESDGSGAYAPVIQRFGSESPLAGDHLILVIHSPQPHSFAYSLSIDNQQAEALFKVPIADYDSLRGRTIHMATLWRRCNAELVVSSSQEWLVAEDQKGLSDQHDLVVSKKR